MPRFTADMLNNNGVTNANENKLRFTADMLNANNGAVSNTAPAVSQSVTPNTTTKKVANKTTVDSPKTEKKAEYVPNYGRGNIDLNNRPQYKHADGSVSTVRSMSFNEDGKEILIPTIDTDKNGNARLLSDQAAIDRYHKTGEYLGKFDNVEEADKYAQLVHENQARRYPGDSNTTKKGHKESNKLDSISNKTSDEQWADKIHSERDARNQLKEQNEASTSRMTKEDKKAAKAEYNALKKYGIEGNTDNQRKKLQAAIDSGILTQEKVNKVREDYYKSSAEGSALAGIQGLGNALAEPVYALGAAAETGLNKLTGGNTNNMREANKARLEAIEKASSDHPIANAAGNFAGKTLQYLGGKEIMDAIPFLSGAKAMLANELGGGKVAQVASDIAFDMLPDIAFDTLPTELNNYANGMGGDELLEDTEKNLATNLLFNVGGAALENADDIYKGVKKTLNPNAIDTDINTVQKDIDNITKALLEKNNEILGLNLPINNAEANIAKEATQEVAKEIPEVMSNKQIEQMLNDINAKNQFTAETGIDLNGTKAENRKAVKDYYNNVDNAEKQLYNLGEGEKINGTEINRAGNPENIKSGELTAGGSRADRVLDEARTYTGEDGRTYTLRNVVDEETSKQMDAAKINNFDLNDTSGATESFSKQLAEAKAANPNGRMVSNQEPKDLEGARLFTNNDNTAGVAILPDGDIVGVHKNPINEMGGAVRDLLITARANGGTKLDCYGSGLLGKYMQVGYTPVAAVEWNPKFKPDDWGDNPTEIVYVMMKDDRTNKQVLEDIANKTPLEIPPMKVFSVSEYGDDAYDTALKYRDDLLAKQTVNEQGAFFYAQNTANNVPVLNNNTTQTATEVPNLIQSNRTMLENTGIEPANISEKLEVPLTPQQIAGVPEGTVPGSVTPPSGVGAPETGDIGISRVFTNTGVNSGLIDEVELAEPNIRALFAYDISHGETTLEKATKRIADETGYNRYMSDYLGGSEQINSATDVDTAMLLTQSLKSKSMKALEDSQAALAAGDTVKADELKALAADYNNQKLKIMANIKQKATGGGQFNQALAKWSHTADGAIMVGETMQKQTTDTFASKAKNAITVNKNRKIAAKLSNEIDIRTSKAIDELENGKPESKILAKKSRDKVREGIANVINDRLGDDAVKFDDAAIDELTRIRLDENAPSWLIADEIQHYLDNGSFYEITGDVAAETKAMEKWSDYLKKVAMQSDTPERPKVEKEETSRMLDSIFKDMGNDGRKAKNVNLKQTKTLAQHEKEVRNSFENEFAKITSDFTDNDYKFVATMINEKVDRNIIEDELQHRLTHGTWYTIDESIPIKPATNRELNSILRDIGNDSKKAKYKVEKPEKSLNTLIEEVKNSFAQELSSVDDASFYDEDYEYIARLFQEKVNKDIIAAEIEHKLTHGTFFTIDESTPIKKVSNGKIDRILKNMGDRLDPDTMAAKNVEKPKKSIATLKEEIKNSFEKENSRISSDLTDDDYEVIANWIDEGVDSDTIESELWHKFKTGEWYTIDESTPVKAEENAKLKSAFNQMFKEEADTIEDVLPETASLSQIKDQVRNTIKNETSRISGDFDDTDVDYLANLIYSGASEKEILDALNLKSATGSYGMSPELQKEVTDLLESVSDLNINDKNRVEIELKAWRKIANATLPKAGFFEKFDAWRYIAMLGNPSTMLRNLIGNTMFGQVVMGVSNNIAAGFESLGSLVSGGKMQRTKAIINPIADKEMLDMAGDYADTHAARQLLGDKYKTSGIAKDIKGAKDVFDSKILQKTSDLVSSGISDYGAAKRKFTTQLTSYLKANGADKSIFDAEANYLNVKSQIDEYVRMANDVGEGNPQRYNELNAKITELMDQEAALAKDVDLMNKARDYAIKEAEFATFHEESELANIINNAKREAKGAKGIAAKTFGTVIEGNIPFLKTPINIAKSGLEVSPLGVFKSLKDTGQLIVESIAKMVDEDAAKNINAAEVISDWSKTLTGTGIAAIGMYMYDRGLIEISSDDREDQNSLEGHQTYSLNIGGKSLSLDWLAPGVMPLFLGAEFKKIYDENHLPSESFFKTISKFGLDDLLNAATDLTQPYLDMSFMSGLSDNIKTAVNDYKYGDVKNPLDIVGNIASNSVTNYAMQGIPTLVKKTARIFDDTKRSTYTNKTGTAGNIERQLNKVENSLPFLSKYGIPMNDLQDKLGINNEFLSKLNVEPNLPSLNTYGEEQKQSPFDNKFANAAYQLLSPTIITNNTDRAADRNAEKAYANTKDAGVFAEYQSKFKIDGEAVSPELNNKAQKTYGNTDRDIRGMIEENKRFNKQFDRLSPEAQKEMLASVDSLSKKVAQSSIEKKYTSDDKVYQAYQKGGKKAAIEYLFEQQHNKVVKSNLEAAGINADSKKNVAIVQEKPGSEKVIKTIETSGGVLDKNGRTQYSAKSILNSIDNMGLSNEDIGYYIANKSTYSLAKPAAAAAEEENYLDVYYYYAIKSALDTDNNGKVGVKNGEINALESLLKYYGISDRYDEFRGYYTK